MTDNNKHTLLHTGVQINYISSHHSFCLVNGNKYLHDDWHVHLVKHTGDPYDYDTHQNLYSSTKTECEKFLQLIWNKLIEQKNDIMFHINLPEIARDMNTQVMGHD